MKQKRKPTQTSTSATPKQMKRPLYEQRERQAWELP